jgi:signal transduction histidine kinase
MAGTDAFEDRILVLAPIGRDAAAIVSVLSRAGLCGEICPTLPDLIRSLDAGAGSAFIGEEALFVPEAELLISWIQQQPAWSDFPFILLTRSNSPAALICWRRELLKNIPNALLLERPADALTLSSMGAAAVRSRQRQYEVRAHLAERAAAAQHLEAQVAIRTAELLASNAALRSEMEEREKAENALRHAQKMEAVGQLTGGLAHDFNNMLAGISGSLELMQARIAQGRFNDLERFLVAAQGASKRAASLTHRLLAFSRRQALEPKPTNPNRLIADMEDLIRRTVGPEITIEIVGAAGIWPTLVDPNQLENALLNLCINARDAMPDAGRLTMETANRWLDESAARERDLPPGQYVSLCVSDTGAGMAPDVVARAFDPFYTTKPVGKGTGLGLSMVFGFARQSGGQVRIYSELGQGTMVCLYLPRHSGAADTADQKPTVAQMLPEGQGETVLIVDDEPTVRMLVADVLVESGYSAIEAPDGVSGLRILQSEARIDLLITDVGLPNGLNGRQMADAARVARPDLKVLFITGYAENARIGNGQLEPGMHVLTKPFSLDALAKRIKELLLG